MRKISLLLAATFAGLASFAQYNVSDAGQAQKEALSIENGARQFVTPKKATRGVADTVVMFNFNDGQLPAGWTTEYAAGSPEGFMVVDNANVPKGAWTRVSSQTIYSTDANNQFLLLPCDFMNCVPGSNPPEMVQSPKDVDATVQSDWIDISSVEGKVQFAMNTTFRLYGAAKLELSIKTKNAEGTESEWTTFDLSNVNGRFIKENSPGTRIQNAAGEDTIVNYVRQFVNISAYTYQQPFVKFSIRWSKSSHYYWAMDDIALQTVSDNDVAIDAIYATSATKIWTEDKTYPGSTELVYRDANYYLTEYPIDFINALNLGLLAHQKGLNGVNVKAEFKLDSVDTEIFSAESQYTIENLGQAGVKYDKILFTDTTGWFSENPPARPVLYYPELSSDFFTSHPDYFNDGIPYTMKYKVSSENEDTDMENNEAQAQLLNETLGRVSYHTSPSAGETIKSKKGTSFHNWVSTTPKTDGLDTKGIEVVLDKGEDKFHAYGVRFFLPKNSEMEGVRKTTFDASGNGCTVRACLAVFVPGQGPQKVTSISQDIGYTLKEEDLGSWIYLPFDEEKTMEEELPTGRYIFGVEVQAYNGQNFILGEDFTKHQAHWQNRVFFKFGGTAEWSWSTVDNGALMIDGYTNLEQFNHDKSDVKDIKVVADNVVVYPNPTTGELNIKNVDNSTINVYSITGAQLMSVKNDAVERTIDLSNFQKGTYLVQVVKDNQVITKKVTLL